MSKKLKKEEPKKVVKPKTEELKRPINPKVETVNKEVYYEETKNLPTLEELKVILADKPKDKNYILAGNISGMSDAEE